MKNKIIPFAAAAALFAAFTSPVAADGPDPSFIVFDSTTKIVYSQEDLGGGVIATVATVVSSTTDGSGVTTVRKLVEKRIPDGAGGYTEIIIQTTITATPDGSGTFTVLTVEEVFETPVDSEGVRGPTMTTSPPDINLPGVEPEDLDLPQDITVIGADDEFEDPPVISPA